MVTRRSRGPSASPSSRRTAPSPERVLVVDDNADLRAAVERQLQGHWTIESAADGQEALDRIRQNPPDLLLADVRMPRLDGLGLLQALRSDDRTRALPVILLSSRTDDESRIEGLDWGADDFLIKPFSSQELIARVAAQLKLARSRREHESELRRSEELLTSALGSARMYAWDWSLETGAVRLSDGALSVIGDWRDPEITQVWASVHPDDVPALRAEFERAVAEAGSYVRRIRFRHFGTGEWIWLELRGRALRDPDGKVRRVVGLALDVSEREEMEAALRESERSVRARGEEMLAIMESTPALILVARDPAGQTIVGNRAAYDALRIEPGLNASVTAADGNGPSHFQILVDGKLVPPEDYPIQRALREGNEIRNYEERIVFSDGTSVDLLGNVVPLRNPDGSVRGGVAAFVDVTKLKAVEAEMRSLNVSLEEKVQERTARMREALRELETFTYSVAHDLRAPLRAMNQMSEILVEEFAPNLGPEGREFARRIGQAAERMDHLTSDLLEYSRVARADVAIHPLVVRQVVEEVLDSLDGDIRQAGAQVRVELGEERIRGNHFFLTQALTNLIANAIKFAKPRIAPEVRIRSSAGEAGRLRLWVEDKGIGIDPRHHPKLFRVFERLHPHGPYKGTGIGLAIVRKAVERMNGTIGVESALGEGCRFYIELPGKEGV
jgi:signal transduction histidine kinase